MALMTFVTGPSVFKIGFCNLDDCNYCTINSKYCESCQPGLIMVDGKCLKNCP